MRSALISIACLALTLACSDKKKPAAEPDEEVAACEDSSDCEQGEVCLDGACASTAPGAVYSDPANAVTPDKVKGELERINEKAEERADEILEGM